ncbi:hypothetical protein BJ166DRAFT_612452 [Pestalotiopsis sp. NC0098]|nr:hypothetical protein BJ166DRAFT_612452 [Pestalotiopsis sp. NC0098]
MGWSGSNGKDRIGSKKKNSSFPRRSNAVRHPSTTHGLALRRVTPRPPPIPHLHGRQTKNPKAQELASYPATPRRPRWQHNASAEAGALIIKYEKEADVHKNKIWQSLEQDWDTLEALLKAQPDISESQIYHARQVVRRLSFQLRVDRGNTTATWRKLEALLETLPGAMRNASKAEIGAARVLTLRITEPFTPSEICWPLLSARTAHPRPPETFDEMGVPKGLDVPEDRGRASRTEHVSRAAGAVKKYMRRFGRVRLGRGWTQL